MAELRLADRVEVRHIRAEDLAHEPAWRGHAHLVVARSFGPLPETAECGLPLLMDGGHLVVSVARAGAETWAAAARTALPFVSVTLDERASGCYLSAAVIGPVPMGLPRRPPARRRAPLF